MKKSLLVLLGLTSILLAGCGSFSQYPPAAISETPTLRVGWMTTRATAGQAIEALKHTDILERNNITAEFPSFLFGPPLNEAAMARQLDFTIVGDMPVVSLLSNSEEWSVVARSIYFPFGLMVRSDLSVTSIADLQGKIVGVPFGSGPQPNTYQWLQEAGLIIGETVQVINLPIDEMAEALTAKRVDAVMTREPTMTTLESKGIAKVLKEGTAVGFICARNEILEKYPEAVKNFLRAYKEAIIYTNQYSDQVNQRFSEDSRFPLDLLTKLRVVDPNFDNTKTSDEIDITIKPEDILKNQEKADFALEQGIIQNPVVLDTYVRSEFVE